MIEYVTTILRFQQKGDKTGWTYIEIPSDIAHALKPGSKKSFRVKGKLDEFPFSKVALLPMGDGKFIMPMNAAIRKGTGKKHGAMLRVKIQEDKTQLQLNKELMECLEDDADALEFFSHLTKSHQFYFSNWIETAKTDPTKVKRITQAVTALSKKMGFGEMLRSLKKEKDQLK
jgi:hypothetical protein